MTRTPPRLLVVVAAVLALSGCGATTIRSGAAAVVGNDRITTGALERLVARGLVDPSAQQQVGADRPGFQRSALSRLIQHEVLLQAVSKLKVSVTPAQIDATADRIATRLGGTDQLKAAAGKAGIAPADLRQTLTDVTLRDALGDRLTANATVPEAQLRQAYAQGIAGYDQVHSAHILVASAAVAQLLLTTVRTHPEQFAALAARFSTDPGSKNKGGDLGFQGRGSLEKPFERAIFAAKSGSVVLARTRFGYHVIKVIERRTTTFDQAAPDLRRGLLSQQRAATVGDLLQRTARQLGVRVNPRFGVWDDKTLDVVATKVDPTKDFTRTATTPGSPLTQQPRP